MTTKQVLQQGEHVAWKHTCNALCVDGLELWIDSCPHCGKPRSAGAAPAAMRCDTARVLEWMRTPNRKAAQFAFTEGPERQAAYWIEIAQGEPAAQQGELVACDAERQAKVITNAIALFSNLRQFGEASAIRAAVESAWVNAFTYGFQTAKNAAPAAQPVQGEQYRTDAEIVQEMLTATDPENAVAEIDGFDAVGMAEEEVTPSTPQPDAEEGVSLTDAEIDKATFEQGLIRAGIGYQPFRKYARALEKIKQHKDRKVIEQLVGALENACPVFLNRGKAHCAAIQAGQKWLGENK